MSDLRYPTFPDVYLPHLREVTLPKVLPVSLEHFKSPPLAEPLKILRRELESARRLSALSPGSRVGVAVGSRGIAALPQVVAGIVAWLKQKGHGPVLIPAMGSHGGADAGTQAQILRDLGMSEEEMGAPILSSMEVAHLGTTPEGGFLLLLPGRSGDGRRRCGQPG